MEGGELLIKQSLHLVHLKAKTPIYLVPKRFVDKSEFVRILAKHKLTGF
jgi:hypothetical protein